MAGVFAVQREQAVAAERVLGPFEVAVDGARGPGPYEEEAWKGRASVKSCSP